MGYRNDTYRIPYLPRSLQRVQELQLHVCHHKWSGTRVGVTVTQHLGEATYQIYENIRRLTRPHGPLPEHVQVQEPG